MPDDEILSGGLVPRATSARESPADKIRRIARDDNLPDDLADDFSNVTGLESGRSHYSRGGQVKLSPIDPKDGQRAVGFSQIKPATARSVGIDNPYDEESNIKAGLRYYAQGGNDPVRRRIAYFSGQGSRAVKYYDRTGQIPKGADQTGTTFKQYIAGTGGNRITSAARSLASQDPILEGGLVAKPQSASTDTSDILSGGLVETHQPEALTPQPTSARGIGMANAKPLNIRRFGAGQVKPMTPRTFGEGVPAVPVSVGVGTSSRWGRVAGEGAPQPAPRPSGMGEVRLAEARDAELDQQGRGMGNFRRAQDRADAPMSQGAVRMYEGRREQLIKQKRDELASVDAPMELGFVTGPDPATHDKYLEEATRRADEQLAAESRQRTPEVIAGRQEMGRMPAWERTYGAPALRVASGLLKTIAGGANPIFGPTALSDYLNKKGQYLEDVSSAPLNAQGEEIVRGVPEKVGTALTDLGFGVVQIAFIQRATGLPMSQIMAMEAALKNSDKPTRERAGEVLQAYSMGKVLDQHLSRPASAALFGGPSALQNIAAVSRGQMTLGDALLDTGIQVGSGAILGGKPGGGNEAQINREAVQEVAPIGSGEARNARAANVGRDLRVATEPVASSENVSEPVRPIAERGINESQGIRPTSGQDSGDVSPRPQDVDTTTISATDRVVPRVGVRLQPSESGMGDLRTDPKGARGTEQPLRSEQKRLGSQPIEPVRHVDEQARRQRGEGKGQFKKETRAQTEDRRAKVEQAVPKEELSARVKGLTSQLVTAKDMIEAESDPVRKKGLEDASKVLRTQLHEALAEEFFASGGKYIPGAKAKTRADFADKSIYYSEEFPAIGEKYNRSPSAAKVEQASQPAEVDLPRIESDGRKFKVVQSTGSGKAEYGGFKTREDAQAFINERRLNAKNTTPSQPASEPKQLAPLATEPAIQTSDAPLVEGVTAPSIPERSENEQASTTQDRPIGTQGTLTASQVSSSENAPARKRSPRILPDDPDAASSRARRVALPADVRGVSIDTPPEPLQPETLKPWQHTRADFVAKDLNTPITNQRGDITVPASDVDVEGWTRRSESTHRALVAEALNRGERIPDTVAAEYPDLIEQLPDAERSKYAVQGQKNILPETPKEPSTTSARTASMQVDREGLGLEQIPRPTVQKDAEVFDRAKAANAKDASEPSRIAEKVLTADHHLSSLETAQIVLRAQDVKNQHGQLMREIAGETDSEVIRSKGLDAEALKREYDRLSEADERSGTEQARAFRIRQRAIDDEFELLPVLARMKVAKGRDLTVAERQKYTDMVAERDQALLDRDAALERAHTAELQKQINKSTRQRKRSETKEALDTEAATIKTNIAAEFARLKSAQSSVHSAFGLGSLDPEGVITKELLKYARNRVKANVGLKAEELIDEVHDLVKGFGASRRQVAEVLSGYMKPRDTREVDRATKELAEIRKEIKDLLAKQDIAAGVRTERAQGPQLSEATERKPGPTVREGQREASRRRSEIAQGLRDQQAQAQAELSVVKAGASEGDAELARSAREQAKEFRKQQSAEREAQERAYREAQTPEQREAAKQQRTPEGPSRRYVTRNETRLKQLQAKEADLTARIAQRDFSPRQKPEPLPYNREVNAAQIRVKQIERAFNEEAAKRAPQTIGDFLVRWKRFAVLGFPSTIGKLGSAATGRMAMTPLYELVGEGMRRVPGLKSVYKDVPRATLAGERAAISQLWQSESFKDVLRHLKGGDDMISLLYSEAGGDEFVQRSSSGKSVIPKNFDELMDRPGHLHAAIKVIPKRAAIFRTFENLLRNEQTKTNGRDVSDPAVQMALMAEAYPEAQRAVLQQRNPVSSLFNRVIQAAATSESRLARGAGKALQFQYPITKVPVNFVGESLTHIGGLPAGLGEIAIRGASQRLKPLLSGENRSAIVQKIGARLPDAIGDLKPEERARIARSLKVGGVGLGFVVWGMMRPDQFGGYYHPGKRDPEDVKAAGMRFMGLNIPRWMGHIPPLEAAQFGATLRRVYDSMAEKGKTKTEAVKEAGIAGTKGMAEEIPFIDPLINSAHGVGAVLGKEGERTKFLGGEAVAMVPGALRQGAKTLDYPKGGSLAASLNPFGSQEPVKREESTVGQIIRGGIPGLRQTVPVKNSSGKLLGSRGGDDPTVKELIRLDHQLNGAQKSKDETPEAFAKRQQVVNATLVKELDSFVTSRRYKSMNDKERKEWIKTLPARVEGQYDREQPTTIRPRKAREAAITLSR